MEEKREKVFSESLRYDSLFLRVNISHFDEILLVSGRDTE